MDSKVGSKEVYIFIYLSTNKYKSSIKQSRNVYLKSNRLVRHFIFFNENLKKSEKIVGLKRKEKAIILLKQLFFQNFSIFLR